MNINPIKTAESISTLEPAKNNYLSKNQEGESDNQLFFFN
jgi:hypothetical protein